MLSALVAGRRDRTYRVPVLNHPTQGPPYSWACPYLIGDIHHQVVTLVSVAVLEAGEQPVRAHADPHLLKPNPEPQQLPQPNPKAYAALPAAL